MLGVPILDTYVAGNVREGETQWVGNGKLFGELEGAWDGEGGGRRGGKGGEFP